MIQIKYTKDIVNSYYEIISKCKAHEFESLTLESYYDKNLKSKLGFSLYDILCGNFEELLEIKEKLGTKYSSKNNIVKQVFNYDKAKSKTIKPKISKLQPKVSKFIEQKLEVHTCYFCNIDFINKFETSMKKIKNGFTLDHVLDKSKYPYLALSLYNLVPSCYICNSKVKRSLAIGDASPTSSTFNFAEKVKFKIFMENENLLLEKEKDFMLLLKEDFSSIYDTYIKIFELDGRYQYHKYKVIEMLNKRKYYPDSRIKELSRIIQKTEEEVKQDLFGEYINKDLHKHPLSKLIKDISKELGL